MPSLRSLRSCCTNSASAVRRSWPVTPMPRSSPHCSPRHSRPMRWSTCSRTCEMGPGQNRPPDLLMDRGDPEGPCAHRHLLVVDPEDTRYGHYWLANGTPQRQLSAELERITAPYLNIFSKLLW